MASICRQNLILHLIRIWLDLLVLRSMSVAVGDIKFDIACIRQSYNSVCVKLLRFACFIAQSDWDLNPQQVQHVINLDHVF